MISIRNFILVIILSTILFTTVLSDSEPNPASGQNSQDSIADDLKERKKLFNSIAPVSPDESSTQAPQISFGFIHAFVASFSVIVVSEIGDKTFFIAAIMAMKHPRMTVFLGAISALGIMTLLSALLGNIITQFIPKIYTFYASTFLFAIFGLKMLYEGYNMPAGDASEEYEDANQTLKETEEKNENVSNEKDVESGQMPATSTQRFIRVFRKYMSVIFLQAFVLTFLAEWGDRSQISTIILGAREDVFGTVIGGTLGHALCTAAAVVGGRFVAQKISVRTVTLVGAVVFLFFAASALFVSPDTL